MDCGAGDVEPILVSRFSTRHDLQSHPPNGSPRLIEEIVKYARMAISFICTLQSLQVPEANTQTLSAKGPQAAQSQRNHHNRAMTHDKKTARM